MTKTMTTTNGIASTALFFMRGTRERRYLKVAELLLICSSADQHVPVSHRHQSGTFQVLQQHILLSRVHPMRSCHLGHQHSCRLWTLPFPLSFPTDLCSR